MKPFLCLLFSMSIVSAQGDAGKLLGKGLLQAVAGLTPVPEQDNAEVLNATALLLMKHVTFRPDGTAASIFTLTGRQHVEWKGLVVKHITKVSLTEADRLNGIGKRYRVAFGCDAHRSWDSKKNAWGEWLPIGNVLFPSGITLDWKGQKWTADPSSRLNHFTPGPGPSISDGKGQKPQAAGLPAGMTRGR